MNSLKAQALSGVKWTTVSAVVCTILQIVKMAVLARLIAKEDFGLFATISVVLGFADFFVEAGLGSAIIHRQNASKEELASAYVINVLLGWLIFLVLFLVSKPISSFYQEPRLVSLLQLSTMIFLFQPFGRQFDALFRKNLRFELLAKIEIFSAIAGFVISLMLAFNEGGVKALIFSQLAVNFIWTVVLVVLGGKNFGYNWGWSWKHARFFFRFGAFQICENSVNYFNAQLDTIIIGKLLGQEMLGVFFMAKQIAFRPIQLINPIITKISLPVFAKIQTDKDRLKRGYLQTVHFLAIIHFAIFPILAGFSGEIVKIFLGNGWELAGDLLKIMSFYTLLRAIGSPVGSLLIATGRVDIGFYWNFCMLFYNPPIVIFSSQWGPIGIALGLLLAMAFGMIPGWYFLIKKLCGATFVEYFGLLIKTIAISALSFCWLLFPHGLAIKFVLLFLGTIAYLFTNRKCLKNLIQS